MNLEELIVRDREKITLENFEDYRRLWSRELRQMPRNSDIWPHIDDIDLREYLRTRGVRTESGVAPFAVMMKPFPCPGQCVYCPLEEGMPKSYLSDEPAAQRAKMLNFDPRLQVEGRIKQMEETGHPTDKIDLIVIGGTFSAYTREYKIEFFKGMYDGVNGVVSESLEGAIEFNQTAKRRVVGISVETRPDWINENEIVLWRSMGVTKVQMGVQALDEQILSIIKRGHSLERVAEATRMCRDAGLKICYHFMPNLPGSSPEKDNEMAKLMFEDSRFGPDYLKVYPAMTIPGSEMYEMWKRGEYRPYDESKLIEVLKEVKTLTPVYCRIDRLVRDISKKWVAVGTQRTNLRQVLQKQLKEEGRSCKCIRCREVRGNVHQTEGLELRCNDRKTLGGRELFLSFEDNTYLYSMLRLRLPDEESEIAKKLGIKGAAVVREVHTYGQVLSLNTHEQDKTQHRGLGKKLLIEAEKIALTNGYKKMAIISAIGTREYYLNLGYRLEGQYMVKDL